MKLLIAMALITSTMFAEVFVKMSDAQFNQYQNALLKQKGHSVAVSSDEAPKNMRLVTYKLDGKEHMQILVQK